jgi:hypothetical protein
MQDARSKPVQKGERDGGRNQGDRGRKRRKWEVGNKYSAQAVLEEGENLVIIAGVTAYAARVWSACITQRGNSLWT